MSNDEFAHELAAQGKRSGKFRHIFGEPLKENFQFLDVRQPATTGEGSYLKANHKFWAVGKASGGGPVYVHRLDQPGRMAANVPLIAVHKGKVLDLDFHPFMVNMLATASEDCSAMVTLFPHDGLTENINHANVELKGHQKKVVLCQFHPSANSVLATGSFDQTVKTWDIEKQAELATFHEMKDNVYSLEWNKDGSQIACSSKDKKIHIFDPRKKEGVESVHAFDGAKSSKVFWAPNLGWIGAFGFNKTASRMLKLWDSRNLTDPIFSQKIDNAASVMMPFYDYDSGLLFTFGKGDGSVSWMEIVNDGKKVYPLGSYRSTEPQKGGGFVPKRGLDVWKCEVSRFLKLTSNAVIPIPLIVPRKAGADVFQADLFPDAFAGKPAMTADEWLSGENKNPIVMSLNPEKRDDMDDEKQVEFSAKMSYSELEAQNSQLKAKVAELEEKLGISGGAGGGGQEEEEE